MDTETTALLDALEQLGKRWQVEVFNLGNGAWCCKIHVWEGCGESPAAAIVRALDAAAPPSAGRGGG